MLIAFFHVIVGIEAADLTSLLEQFEETQGNHLFSFFFFLKYKWGDDSIGNNISAKFYTFITARRHCFAIGENCGICEIMV